MTENSSRELIYKTLEFDNPSRAPYNSWMLPWARNNYPAEVEAISARFPDDIAFSCGKLPVPTIAKGDMYIPGTASDDWGCIFTNRQSGIIGEVKNPIVIEENWEDFDNVHIPKEWLTFDAEDVNRYCKSTDKFVLAGACPNPYERMQYIRGTENLMIDIALENEGFLSSLNKIHTFYCELLELWAKTDVDALHMMDDWGTQRSLLISPAAWRKIFKPLYKDYSDIAHRNGKKFFMHSDGYILDIYPDLIEIGLDAVNSQLFCMDFDKLAEFKGKITFWGEIDRQHILPYGTREDVYAAVQKVYDHLWHNGGCISQYEFSIGTNPKNAFYVHEAWEKLTAKS